MIMPELNTIRNTTNTVMIIIITSTIKNKNHSVVIMIINIITIMQHTPPLRQPYFNSSPIVLTAKVTISLSFDAIIIGNIIN